MKIGEREPGQIENEASAENILHAGQNKEVAEVSLEEFCDEKIAAAETAGEQVIEAGRSEADRIEDTYGSNKEISTKYRAQLEVKWQQIKELISAAKKGLKKVAIGYSVLVATAGTAEGTSLERQVDNPQGKQSIGEVQKEVPGYAQLEKAGIALAETENLKGQDIYENKIKKLKRSAIEDDFEKVLITSESDRQLEFAENGEDEERRDFSHIGFEKIEKFIKSGAKRVEIIHTHPWAALPGYLQHETIRNGKPIPMIPSVSDLSSLIIELYHFKEKNKLIENKIIDPTGEWTYKIADEKNYFIKKYLELLNEINSPDFFEKNLTKEESERLYNNADFLRNIHPELQQMYYPKKLRDKIEKDFIQNFPEKGLLDFSSEDKSAYLKSYTQVFNLARRLATYDENRSDQETNALIEKYIKECKKIGFEVSYKPFED